ncbi:MAG: DUF1934 domain-containing protein [Lachnospiraceae bacterium]|nr:DUF1934 domain-containing protein [Lachnospiraceae bacterium]
MKKDVLVAIRGLQIDESSDEDAVEILVNGRYNAKNGRHFLRFEQYEEDGTPTKNILTFDEKAMELTRRGGTQLHMTFMDKEKTMTSYTTPFGSLMVGVNTDRISVEESDDRIHAEVDYGLEFNYEYVADCQLSVDITPRR